MTDVARIHPAGEFLDVAVDDLNHVLRFIRRFVEIDFGRGDLRNSFDVANGCPLTVLTTNAKDTGSYAFDGSPFRPADKSDPICNYTLQVMRDVDSDIGSPFAGGRLLSRSIGSTPLRFHKQ